MTKHQLEAKRILDQAMREARWREQRTRYQAESDEALSSGRRSITSTPNGLSEARRQELRRIYGLALPDDIPVAPDPTARPTVLSLNEMAKGVTLPPGLHQRLAEACGAPPLVTVPEGLHERLAAALGHRRQRETGV
jgi:hypothetical protein